MSNVIRQPRRPNGAAWRALSVRVPAEVYLAAQAAAADNGETLSAAVVRFLRRYAREQLARRRNGGAA